MRFEVIRFLEFIIFTQKHFFSSNKVNRVIFTDEDCITPNNKTGTCKPLYNCPDLLQQLITQNKEVIDFVRQSHCGIWSSDTQPLVCCGNSTSQTETKISTDPVTVSSPSAKKMLSDKRFCGFQHTDDYFYTGNVTAIDEFPWLGLDADTSFNEFGCAGSLITSRYVLTAAQCLRLRSSSVVAVRFGEYNIKHDVDCVKFSEIDECSNPVEDVGIAKKIKHPKYNRRLGIHDIALLMLNRIVHYSDYIRPICLPDAQTKFAQIGDVMTLTGFGRVDTYKDYAIIKKKITSKLITNEQCANEFSIFIRNDRQVTDNIMCTKELAINKDRSCEGDSGGPLMFSHRTQWHIEGIAVWSTDICSIDFPFAYTRVANYMDWIQRTKYFWFFYFLLLVCFWQCIIQRSILVLFTDEDCITPNNKTGTCKPLYNCPELLQQLITQKKEVIDFVRQSHCGIWSSDTQPLVCCGNTTSQIETKISTDPVTVSSPSAKKVVSDKRLCGFQHTDDYFYTGNVTAIDEFPWLGPDADTSFNEFGCAGSLITRRYVLTAAHCLRLRSSSVVAVRFGEYNIKHDVDCVKFSEIDECSNPVEDVGIEKKIKHPKYNRRLGIHDIALLMLNRMVHYIRPICLPDAQTKFAQIGDVMTLTGFGRVDTYKDYAIIKKKITSKLITNEQCANEFSVFIRNDRQVTDNIMCTKELAINKDRSCEGDSGGPLMFSHRTQWHIEGIAVWSTDICSIDFPFAYTRVANYMDWIERTVVV
ncbi:hypothetical protein RI129_004088 [Pyrocoelia pectoralis]|uniref:CLIP domain-containing serine protease n=1 Tax=Pyrocoelia pectoralis TaxID=417401 RepID=A0AAN7VG29_9COLE